MSQEPRAAAQPTGGAVDTPIHDSVPPIVTPPPPMEFVWGGTAATVRDQVVENQLGGSRGGGNQVGGDRVGGNRDGAARIDGNQVGGGQNAGRHAEAEHGADEASGPAVAQERAGAGDSEAEAQTDSHRVMGRARVPASG